MVNAKIGGRLVILCYRVTAPLNRCRLGASNGNNYTVVLADEEQPTSHAANILVLKKKQCTLFYLNDDAYVQLDFQLM